MFISSHHIDVKVQTIFLNCHVIPLYIYGQWIQSNLGFVTPHTPIILDMDLSSCFIFVFIQDYNSHNMSDCLSVLKLQKKNTFFNTDNTECYV